MNTSCPDTITREAPDDARLHLGETPGLTRGRRLMLYALFIGSTLGHAISLPGRSISIFDWFQGVVELALLTVVLCDVMTLVEPVPRQAGARRTEPSA